MPTGVGCGVMTGVLLLNRFLTVAAPYAADRLLAGMASVAVSVLPGTHDDLCDHGGWHPLFPAPQAQGQEGACSRRNPPGHNKNGMIGIRYSITLCYGILLLLKVDGRCL